MLGLAGSLGGAAIQAGAASSAAAAQERAANEQTALAREQFETVRGDLVPYRGAGQNSLAAFLYEMGLGPRPTVGGTPPAIREITETRNNPGVAPRSFEPEPGMGWADSQRQNPNTPGATEEITRFGVGDRTFDTRKEAETWASQNLEGGTPYEGFTGTPGYDFRLREGTNAIEAGAAARGGLYSGRTMQALNRFGQDYATGEYNNFLARLAGLTDMGLGASGMQANASNAYVAQAGQALANRGNAQAAGAIGVGNAIGGGIQNAMGFLGYQQGTTGQRPPAVASPRPWWHGTA